MDRLWQNITDNAVPIQAICAIAAVVIAVAAATIALYQLRAGYRIHREQAQPYVAVGMRPLNRVDSRFIEFFVRNFGQTAAFEVQLKSVPPLQQVWQEKEVKPMWLFDVLPTLVPGDEWTQMLGYAPSHFQNDLPMKYDVTMTWRDSCGKAFSAHYVLDWEAHRNRTSISEKTIHHLAKTAKEIDKDLKGIHEVIGELGTR